MTTQTNTKQYSFLYILHQLESCILPVNSWEALIEIDDVEIFVTRNLILFM